MTWRDEETLDVIHSACKLERRRSRSASSRCSERFAQRASRPARKHYGTRRLTGSLSPQHATAEGIAAAHLGQEKADIVTIAATPMRRSQRHQAADDALDELPAT